MSPIQGLFLFWGGSMDICHRAASEIAHAYNEYLEFAYEQRGCTIQELSYAKIAAQEIIRRIQTEKNIPPIDVVELFKLQMHEYYERANLLIFSVAYKTAEDVIDLLMS